MSMYREWRDFVTYPLDPGRIHSREQRLDASSALRADDPRYEPGGPQGSIVTEKMVVGLFDDGDRFEAMEVDDAGGVTVWTQRRVWCLRRDRGMEKLVYVPRHPRAVGDESE